MVETRSKQKPKRTATSQAQGTRQQTTLQESDEEIESIDDISENESEYGTTVIRAPKRRKRSRATAKALGKRTSKRLDLLFSMPLDIIFEVASHLAPRDLIALSKTSRVLCRTLCSPNASSLWKAARNAAGAPDCSPGFSEPQWASLMFGKPVCQQCNTTNIYNIEFGVRRRVCIPCKKHNLVPAVRFGKVFPDYDASIMDMVPHTRSGGWTPRRQPQSPGKFFWKSDVERIASEWAALQRDIHMYVKGARAKAAAYRKQRIDEAGRIAEHASVCDDWSRQVSWNRQNEAYKKIRERLLALGYDDEDIRYSICERPASRKMLSLRSILGVYPPRL
ncbi:hypothetical protein BD779DRAFT_1171151 [Infundibulicybe gibba]|nr:hypothetical protein BD779DRAFT_1171151 [Infundibulicybe gibba]